MTTALSLWKGVVTVPCSMKAILQEVADEHGLDYETLRCSLTHKREITWPRQEFMWRARQAKFSNGSHRFTLPQIGRFLGGMDHTTVLHGIRRHAKRNGDDRKCRIMPEGEGA